MRAKQSITADGVVTKDNEIIDENYFTRLGHNYADPDVVYAGMLVA